MRSWMTLAPLLLLAALPASALGQGPTRPGITPSAGPGYSPYLNLVRPGAPAGINYYGLVRPEINFRNSISGLQTDVAAQQQLLTTGRAATGTTGLLTTGHAATFLNTGGYFLNSTGGVGAQGGARTTGTRAQGAGQGVGGMGTTPKKTR
jgi:hypothetical protein